MTTATAAFAPRRITPTAAIAQTAAVTWRNLMHVPRNPQLLVFMVIQPIMFVVLFAYVFGGAIDVPGGNYLDFLIPGILAQTVAFGTTATAVALSEDMAKGIVDRLRSLPIARSAVLSGRVVSDTARIALTVTIIVGIGTLLGFRTATGVGGLLAMMALGVAFGAAMSWVAATIGLVVSTPEVAQSAGFIWLFPLTFASSAFVPPETMPSWLQGFADVNPITIVVDAMRALALGGPTADLVWQSIAWIVGITVVFAPLAVRAYRRAT